MNVHTVKELIEALEGIKPETPVYSIGTNCGGYESCYYKGVVIRHNGTSICLGDPGGPEEEEDEPDWEDPQYYD